MVESLQAALPSNNAAWEWPGILDWGVGGGGVAADGALPTTGSLWVASLRVSNLDYRAGSPRAQLDVATPEGIRPASGWPVVLLIHGGGWYRFSKESMTPLVDALVRRGYAVVNINYTLSRPNAPSWPQCRDDVQESVRWIKRNAGRFGLDPERIAAVGQSAGGHLALMVGLSDPVVAADGVSSAVRATVSLSGPTDLSALASRNAVAASRIQGLMGFSPNRADADQMERLRAASPRFYVSAGDSPVLVIHGDRDNVVPISQSRALADQLALAGVVHDVVILRGATHESLLASDLHRVVETIDRFLQVHLHSQNFPPSPDNQTGPSPPRHPTLPKNPDRNPRFSRSYPPQRFRRSLPTPPPQRPKIPFFPVLRNPTSSALASLVPPSLS
ncbi:hypothetical protein Isop_2508 [Isosphaera pallida ATCC 43644]|uniref:BD-FAE-like domain-containing protein n=1 Tax=Isosphaera pallida (strain ATCC 43644 / DSM 9630 / IS1B) TaxID=575540 RepID=E8QY85_ISOPI|nr:alpha/beta hydrolase [Isosphaera pallida]ADV63080.1 hypothetical protein Isop_2508 [Isosphaera pallida ATCC 43644]